MERVKPGYSSKQTWGDLPRLDFPPLVDPQFVDTFAIPSQPLIVACVNVGTKFPAHYVERLRNMVARNTGYVYEFVCITDRDDLHDYARCIRPPRDLPGWYSKINLFHPDTFPEGHRILYFDLDVVITGSIDVFFEAQNPFIMIREFSGGGNGMAHNSSVMAWTAGEANEINEGFTADWMRRSWGDQECIWTLKGNGNIWNWDESLVRSYKYSNGELLEDCRVVVMHGDPKPCALVDSVPWIREHWR